MPINNFFTWKIKCVLFGNRPSNSQNIRINDVGIDTVLETTLLGVITDDKWSWKSPISHVKTKMAISIAILYKAPNFLSQKSLYTLYFSLIAPYMTYCVAIWETTFKTKINSVILLQKRATRILSKKPDRLYTCGQIEYLYEVIGMHPTIYIFFFLLFHIPFYWLCYTQSSLTGKYIFSNAYRCSKFITCWSN